MRLAREGRHVVLASRTQRPLEDVQYAIAQHGGSAEVCVCDVGDAAGLAAAIESVGAKHGRLDVLVNNAGITRDGLVLRMSDEDWNEVIRVNLTSAFVATRAAARLMMKGKFGRIVNIASTSGASATRARRTTPRPSRASSASPRRSRASWAARASRATWSRPGSSRPT